MPQAQKGDTVAIHYTGRLDDGTVFDTSESREPLEFTLGEGQVIPGFESVVEGMELGEEKTAVIPSDEAYGPRRDELLLKVARERLPEGLDPDVGQRLEMKTSDGQVVPVVVAHADDKDLVLDANHPLAGADLTFEIELVKINGE